MNHLGSTGFMEEGGLPGSKGRMSLQPYLLDRQGPLGTHLGLPKHLKGGREVTSIPGLQSHQPLPRPLSKDLHALRPLLRGRGSVAREPLRLWPHCTVFHSDEPVLLDASTTKQHAPGRRDGKRRPWRLAAPSCSLPHQQSSLASLPVPHWKPGTPGEPRPKQPYC